MEIFVLDFVSDLCSFKYINFATITDINVLNIFIIVWNLCVRVIQWKRDFYMLLLSISNFLYIQAFTPLGGALINKKDIRQKK